MGGFGVALDALGGRCIFMSELEGKYFRNAVALEKLWSQSIIFQVPFSFKKCRFS